MVTALRTFRRPHCGAGENGRGGSELKPRDCHPYLGGADLHLGHRFRDHQTLRAARFSETGLALPRSIRRCDRAIVVVLLPGLAARRSLAGRSGGQIERRFRHRIFRNYFKRATELATCRGWRTDRRRGVGPCMAA